MNGLESSVRACLQVEDHIQEVGYFDVDLGGYTQATASLHYTVL